MTENNALVLTPEDIQHAVQGAMHRLGDVFHDDLVQDVSRDVYERLLSRQHMLASETATVSDHMVASRDVRLHGGHEVTEVSYHLGTQRKVMQVTQDALLSGMEHVLLSHSDLLGRPGYFIPGLISHSMTDLELEIYFQPPFSLHNDGKRPEHVRLSFTFLEHQYVDIVTWERFESWYHVEQNRPIIFEL